MKTTMLFRHTSIDTCLSINSSERHNTKMQLVIHNDDNSESMTIRVSANELAMIAAKLTHIAVTTPYQSYALNK